MKLVALVMLLAACGGKEPPPAAPPAPVVTPDAAAPEPPRDDIQRVIAKLQAFADEMCKCPDRACAESVHAKVEALSAELAQEVTGERNATEAEVKQMTEIGAAYGECMAKLTPP